MILAFFLSFASSYLSQSFHQKLAYFRCCFFLPHLHPPPASICKQALASVIFFFFLVYISLMPQTCWLSSYQQIAEKGPAP